MSELREEPPSGPAGRRLWEEYAALVKSRIGPSFRMAESIFGSDDELSVFLVAYDGGEPVACGALHPLAGDCAEIKRMFVTGTARRRGHGRRMLRELERRAAEAGFRRARLLTTEVLAEALELYAAAGYEVVETREIDGRRDFWLERDLPVIAAASPPASGPSARRPG